MFSITLFNFNKYDVGGNGAVANDLKLEGDEIKKARLDGWDIKENSVYTMLMGTPSRLKEDTFVGIPYKRMTKPQAEKLRLEQKEQQYKYLEKKAQLAGVPYNADDFQWLIEEGDVKPINIHIKQDEISYKTVKGDSTYFAFTNGKISKIDSYQKRKGYTERTEDTDTYPKQGKYKEISEQKKYRIINGSSVLYHEQIIKSNKNGKTYFKGITYFPNEIEICENGKITHIKTEK